MFDLADMTITIDTLGKAARHRMILQVTCRRCGHAGNFTARDLARTKGFGRDPKLLTFRCTRCTGQDCIVRVMEEIRR